MRELKCRRAFFIKSTHVSWHFRIDFALDMKDVFCSDDIMKIFPYLFMAALTLPAATAHGQLLEYRSNDTVWIDSISCHSGQKVSLDILFSNADTVNAIDLPITYTYSDLIIDSISFAGSRLESCFLTIAEINAAEATCHLGGFYFDTTKEELGPGRGLLARLYLTIPEEYPTLLVPVDTTFINTGLTFVAPDNTWYVPIFLRGYIDNTYAPNLPDSVWVDSADVDPGQYFSIAVNAFNEHPVLNVRIPLEYQSDNIVLDSMTLSGTRAFNAVISDLIIDNDAKRALITLGFSSGQLLPTGGGPVAMLHFTCQSGGSTATVTVDTTANGFGEYYFQLGTLFNFVKTYPRFRSGTIHVDLSTDVDQDALQIPTQFALEQNYPNPFNPATIISFSLPERTHVVLEIYNILGQKVRTLVNRTLPAGIHTVVFDSRDDNGHNVTSGVYFYRLKTAGWSRSMKMMLMK